MTAGGPVRGTCDAHDRLIEADPALAGLHMRCGGDWPGGVLAVPALLALVRRTRVSGVAQVAMLGAVDEGNTIAFLAQVAPDAGGTRIALSHWRLVGVHAADAGAADAVLYQIARIHAVLDADQRVLAVELRGEDDHDAALHDLIAQWRSGSPVWSEAVNLVGVAHRQPMHWRLADGASVLAEGSQRAWRVAMVPQALHGGAPTGFELCLNSDTLLAPHAARDAGGHLAERPAPETLDLGREVAPVLRQPIARIIANAETIHLRLAGPLQEEYSRYAGDIAAAGQHMLELVDDLADLDVVEADGFTTAADHIDLADAVRRAAGILSIRAREKGIGLEVPGADEHLPAIAEFRRVLQVLLNLIGNAIRYSTENTPINAIRYTPDNPPVRVTLERAGARARVIVADSGQGLSADEQARVFEKFERLGRAGDGGSGLGLYISRRLARAMGGDLTVESAKGEGARFILEVPADLGV